MIRVPEDLLESFENGTFISLKSNDHYVSCDTDPFRHTEISLTLRQNCNDWEQFRLTKWNDGTFSLQHPDGGYISPLYNEEDKIWTTRGHCLDWERFHFDIVSHDTNTLIKEVSIYTIIDGNRWYLRNKNRNLVVSADRTAWTINLVQVPSFNLTGLNLKNHDSWSTFDARFIAPGSIQPQ